MEQGWLFRFEPPLDRRLGREFFRALPTGPGVYRLLGEDGRTLYVGKAKNLRVRLQSYRRAEPGRATRKTLRLLARVRSILWEKCADETSALLRENALLRAVQPPFNVQKTRPQFYGFVGVGATPEGIRLRVAWSPEPRGDTVFGAFKGVWLLRSLCQSFARLGWLLGSGSGPLPARLGREPLGDGLVPEEVAPASALRRYFAGTSDALAARLADAVAARDLDSFAASVAARDLELVREFFARSARRGLTLRRRHGLRRLIPQTRIDDLLVLSQRAASL